MSRPRKLPKQPPAARGRAEKIPTVSTSSEIAVMLGITTRRVRQLAAEFGVKPTARGRYNLAEMLRVYTDVIRREGERRVVLNKDREREINARARQIEARIAREELKLIPADGAVAYVQMVVGTLISLMEGLPSQFTRDLDERRRLSAAIDGIRKRVAEAEAEARANLLVGHKES